MYSWPVWGPLPEWLAPGGNWQTGLATGVAGFLVGTLTLRIVRFTFGLGIGAEYMDEADPESVRWSLPWRLWDWVGRVGGKTLGLGDADLMMMAGAFLGWQPTLTAFFLAVVPGLMFGMVQIFQRGDNALPFGPSLAIGAMIAALGWQEIGPPLQVFFFNGPRPLYPLPFFPDERPDDFVRARPFGLELACPWWLVGANACDLQHFAGAHDRVLAGPPFGNEPDDYSPRASPPFSVPGHSRRGTASLRGRFASTPSFRRDPECGLAA